MNPIHTPRRVAATLSKGRKRLPFAICFLCGAVVFTCWQLASPSVSEPSTQPISTAPVPIGTGTFDIKLHGEGGASK